MTGHRIGLDLFSDVLDVPRRHGFAGGDNLHAGRAIFLIGVLVRIYDSSRDHPNRPSTSQPPRCQLRLPYALTHQLAVQLQCHEQDARPHVARPSQTPPASQPIRRSASDY